MKMRLALGVVAVVALGLLATTACGGGDEEGDDMQEQVQAEVTLDITAENMQFVPDSVEVPAGKVVTIRMQNEDANQHDFEVGGLTAEIMGRTGMEDESMDMDMSGGMMGPINMHSEANGEASVTFRTDKPGTYEIYCTITGHKESGMVGKLIVS